MPESEDRALFDFDVVRRGHGNLGMTEHPLGRDQAKAGVYLRAEFLPERVQRRAGDDALGAEPID